MSGEFLFFLSFYRVIEYCTILMLLLIDYYSRAAVFLFFIISYD